VSAWGPLPSEAADGSSALKELEKAIETMGKEGKIQDMEKAYNELEEELGKIKNLF
jgi:hypothetical protein